MTVMICDLDGVLVDFAGGVAGLFAKDVPGPESAGQPLHEALGLRSGQMWSRIDEQGASFWAGLAPTPEADDLVLLLREAGDLVIATSPSMHPGSADGKTRWLQKRFGKRFRDYLIGARKELLAAPDRLLIDDRESHVEAFRAAGGQAVLYPTWENGTRQADADPVAVVKDAIAAM